MRFGASASKLNFQVAERLVPPGFPLVAHQPVYRFRKQAQEEIAALYQVGPGMFSANAVPPYQNWAQFEPIVREGIDALLHARDSSEKNVNFLSTSLRYIDAFNSTLTQGRDVSTFLDEVLGIKITLPSGLTQQLAEGSKHKPTLQFQLPMTSGMIMSLGIGEGLFHETPAIVMDCTVGTTTPVAASLDAVMATLTLARAAIHDTFFALTSPISHLMHPTEST